MTFLKFYKVLRSKIESSSSSSSSDASPAPPTVDLLPFPAGDLLILTVTFFFTVVLVLLCVEMRCSPIAWCRERAERRRKGVRTVLRPTSPDRGLCTAMQELYPHSVVNIYDLRKKQERANRMLRDGEDITMKHSDVLCEVLANQDYSAL